MGRFGRLMGRIPGVPTKKSLGRRAIVRGYSSKVGDADVLGHVKTPAGRWELVPCDHTTDLPQEWRESLPDWYIADVSEWYIPRDGSRPYPADGVGGAPGRLFGVPIAIGFRNFGEIRRVPNTEIMRNVHVVGEAEPPEEPEESGGVLSGFRSRLEDRFGWLFDADARADWWCRRGFSLYRGRKLLGKGYSADSLQLAQDPDGRWALERLQFDSDIGVYQSEETGHEIDASGLGAEPADLFEQPVGYGNAEEPQMKAAVTPRLGRNLHEEKLATPQQSNAVTVGGEFTHDGQEVVTDGGVETPQPREATARRDDIILEERAFVLPEDTRLLGGNQELSETVETIKERAKVSQNMPGDGMMDMAFRYGGIFMGLIMGWWFGKQGAGGGGGGGSITGGVTSAIPGHVGLGDVGASAMDLALQVGMLLPGVIG